MGKRVHYSGDLSIRHGGLYYSLGQAEYGFVNAVRVTPFSDAGGADNQFWVEELTINFRRDSAGETRSMLATLGMEEEENPTVHLLIEAALAYGYCDRESIKVVQIGPQPEPASEPPLVPDVKLRSHASLRKWVWKEYCAYGKLD